MELSRRPIPEVPWSCQLAEWFEPSTTCPGLPREDFRGIGRNPGEARVAPSEWNAKEVLAHLIHSERGQQAYIDEVVSVSFASVTISAAIATPMCRGTVKAYGTIRMLLQN